MASKCGIICEYNPFHNGHKYHLQKTKELTGCDVICVMSGDFTQRCHPAIFDKSLRATAAIQSGASAVVELPILYSTAAAEFFAYGAIKIFSQIQGLEYISFGIETDDTELLIQLAIVQLKESGSFKEKLTALSKTGLSYPNCIAQATACELAKNGYSERNILDILCKPNNVLAIEYLKAIKKLNLNIKPIFIRRTDSGYNSDILTPPYAAAGAIRKLISEGKDYSDFVPFDFGDSPLNPDIFEALAHHALLNKDIAYDEGLGVRLKKAAQKYSSLPQIIEKTKTKRYTYSRINRTILSTMSDIGCELLHSSDDFLFKMLAVAKGFRGSIKDFGNNLITRFDKLDYDFFNFNTTRFNLHQSNANYDVSLHTRQHSGIANSNTSIDNHYVSNNSFNKNEGKEFARRVLAIDKKASDLYSIVTGQSPSRFFSKLLVL